MNVRKKLSTLKSSLAWLNSNIFLATIGICFLCYISAFSATFGVHNDYGMIPAGHTTLFSESYHLIAVGRSVGAILLNIHASLITHTQDFAISRLVSWLILMAFSVGVANRAIKAGFCSVPFACLLVLSFLLNPAAQLYVLWSTNLVPGSLNLLLAFGAYILFFPLNGQASIVQRLIALGLFFISLEIYPPTSTVVFVLALIDFLAHRQPIFVQLLKRISPFLLTCLFYFLFERFIAVELRALLGIYATSSGLYEFSMGIDPMPKLRFLAKLVLLSSDMGLGVFSSQATFYGAILTLGIIMIGFIQLTPKQWLSVGGAFFVVFILANAPLLAANGLSRLPGYRAVFVGYAIFFICCIYLFQLADIKFIKRAKYYMIVALMIASFWNVNDSIRSWSREYDFIHNAVVKAQDFQGGLVYVQHAHRGSILVDSFKRFEFGWLHAGNDPYTIPLIHEAVRARPDNLPLPDVTTDIQTDLEDVELLIDVTQIVVRHMGVEAQVN